MRNFLHAVPKNIIFVLFTGIALNTVNIKADGAPMSGVYTINAGTGGPGSNYTGFSAAVADLLIRGVAGPVIFNVADGAYYGQFSIPPISGSSAVNTITFQSASHDSTKVLVYDTANGGNNYVIQLAGASYITLVQITVEQRGGANGDGTALDIRLNACNNRFMNNRFIGDNRAFDVTVADNQGYADTANWYINNIIRNGYYAGIDIEGSSGAYSGDVRIVGNTIDSFLWNGIALADLNNPVVTDNYITDSSMQNPLGLFATNIANGGSVLRNKIYLPLDGTGIYINSWSGDSSSNYAILANNFVSLIGDSLGGQALFAWDLSNLLLIYNSFLSEEPYDYVLYINELISDSNVFIENNNLVNVGGGYVLNYSNSGLPFKPGFPSETAYPFVSDYNNVYNNGTSPMISSGAEYAGLTDFRQATGLDLHSISANPLFASVNDLHANACALKNRGIPFHSITTDIDGKKRGTYPDVGANEITGIAGQWTGATGTNWNSTFNWCDDTVPTCHGGQDVVIPNAAVSGITTTNYPVINDTGNSVANLTINPGASLTMQSGSSLAICGNFVNNGTFTANGGAISLGKNGAQSFAGAKYWDLKVVGSGAKTLVSNAEIQDSLVLTNGNITTGANTITLDSTSYLKEGNVGNQVWGVLKTQQYMAGDNNATKHIFANIGCDLSTKLTAGLVTITRTTGAGATITDPANGYSSIERNIHIAPSENQGNLQGHIYFHFLNDEMNGIPKSTLMLFRDGAYPAGHWTYITGSTLYPETVNQTTDIIDRGNIDSLGDWTLGSYLTPLPVGMVSFTASLQGPQTARLEWVTASEQNNNYFIVERSADGGNTFDSIGWVKGNGTTQATHEYTYFDNNIGLLMASVIYYRLRQVDMNGTVNDPGMGVREITLSQAASPNETKVWFNGPENRMYINLVRVSGTAANILITDIGGKVIASQCINANKGITQLSLNMEGMANGIYLVRITDNTGTFSQKVVKD